MSKFTLTPVPHSIVDAEQLGGTMTEQLMALFAGEKTVRGPRAHLRSKRAA